jgi:hypothetical protein
MYRRLQLILWLPLLLLRVLHKGKIGWYCCHWRRLLCRQWCCVGLGRRLGEDEAVAPLGSLRHVSIVLLERLCWSREGRGCLCLPLLLLPGKTINLLSWCKRCWLHLSLRLVQP